MRPIDSIWQLVINTIKSQDIDGFTRMTRLSPDILKTSIGGSTLFHHITYNANAGAVEALQHLISLAKENGAGLEKLLNTPDQKGHTPVSICVKFGDSSNLAARIALMHILLKHGADPSIGNKVYLLTQVSVTDQKTIASNSGLKSSVKECHDIMSSFIFNKAQKQKSTDKEALRQLHLACSSEQRQKTLEIGAGPLFPKIK